MVGVADDVRHDGLATLVQPEICRPFDRMPMRNMYLVLETARPPLSVERELRDAVASIDPTVPVSEVSTTLELVRTSTHTEWMTALLMLIFAGASLVLSAVGVYGLLSHLVTRQRREIGIRVALGARRSVIVGSTLGKALILASFGSLLGIAVALSATRAIEGLLFGVQATDTWTLLAVPAVMTCVALAAAFVPASRAARVDPTIVLRSD